MTKPVYILNGPNLNLLGQRQPEIYGATTLEDIKSLCENHAATQGLEIAFHQSNHEGVLVDQIQEARVKGCGIILNAAAYTHTSVAILDALLASDLPIIEVHLSNIHQRDTFRHHSFVSKAAKGMICGFGAQGYVLALDALKPLIAPSS
ncbi:type II 3-dehydroquinate dehydratase [Thalassospira sp. TSL5-1]|uniref:type II 3-dehydroquinate dehydratase n=1 Tax=Thalassospira sp. TSL5-1 TaxID=1544451 RepID=UPI000939DAB7|nr:type II 3-dehydroquinate dehydratase [Thalassospira sp. TSL5-1]OKH86987.1 3-dehydroquinate dehydratase [Thalassospira sp. TSL5-1]